MADLIIEINYKKEEKDLYTLIKEIESLVEKHECHISIKFKPKIDLIDMWLENTDEI